MMPATLTCTGNTVARHRSDRSPGGSQSVATQRAAGEHTLSTVRKPVFSVSPSTGPRKARDCDTHRSPPSTYKRPVSPPSAGQRKHCDTHRLQTTGLFPAHRNDQSLLPAQAKENTVTHTVYKRPVRLLPCTGQGKHCDTYRLQTTGLLPPPTNDRSPPSSYKRPVSSQLLQTTGLLPAPTNDRSPPRTGQAGKPHTSALH